MAPLISELVNQPFLIHKSNQEIIGKILTIYYILYQMASLIIELINQILLSYLSN